MLEIFRLGGAGVLVVAMLWKMSTMPASRRRRLRSNKGRGFVMLVWFYPGHSGAAGPVPLLTAVPVIRRGVRLSGPVGRRPEAV